MTNADHIKTLRLFELSRASGSESFKLQPWESNHLRDCKECQDGVEVFERQFKEQQPQASSRSDVETGALFKAGDDVQILGPGQHRGKRGVIAEVIESTNGDYIYRYRVEFLDGASDTFFGFEIEFDLAA